MSFVSKSQYVLNSKKFKKAARGLQIRLSGINSSGDKLPLQSVMQALSQELFGMPYEEAKATILLDGTSLIAPQKENSPGCRTGAPSIEVTRDDWGVLIHELSEILPASLLKSPKKTISVANIMVCLAGLRFYFPSTAVRDTLRYESWFKSVQERHPLLLSKLWSETRGINVGDNFLDGISMHETRSIDAMTAMGSALAQKKASKTLGLRDLEECLTDFNLFISLAFDENVAKLHRAAVLSILDSLNYIRPSVVEPTPSQRRTTLEHFDYIIMEPLSLIRQLLREMESLN